MDITIKRTNSHDPDFDRLVELLNEELRQRFGVVQQLYEQHNKIEKLLHTVVIAYTNDVPVGCGCFKEMNVLTAEIKRMFVMPEYRGNGVAAAILNELESWAKGLNFQRTVLETGRKLHEAVSLYEKAGYKEIENYEPYIGMTESLCMEKKLAY